MIQQTGLIVASTPLLLFQPPLTIIPHCQEAVEAVEQCGWHFRSSLRGTIITGGLQQSMGRRCQLDEVHRCISASRSDPAKASKSMWAADSTPPSSWEVRRNLTRKQEQAVITTAQHRCGLGLNATFKLNRSKTVVVESRRV